MLGQYCKGQPVAYNILKNAIEKKTIAHAYLFQADDDEVAFNFAIAFAKTMICPSNRLNNQECDECTVCHRIDNHNYPELKIIEPDGLWIKKEKLHDLQDEFKMKPLEGDKKIYVIKGVEKLNVWAANSILKFLEEPEPNIIAILTTSEVRKVLPTIVSRCQLVVLRSNVDIIDDSELDSKNNRTLVKLGKLYCKNSDELKQFVLDEKNVAKIEIIVKFAKNYETLNLDVLLNIKKMWNDYFTEKEDYLWAFDVMAMLYKDVLNVMYNMKCEVFDHYFETIEFIASQNNRETIIHKLQKIVLTKEKIKYNINLNLLMDKLIIEMESGEHTC